MLLLDEVDSPCHLSAVICDYYGFSASFRDGLVRFLRQAPACHSSGLRKLDDCAELFCERFGWSFDKASQFVRCLWPLSMSDKSFVRGQFAFEEVA
ncbi:hypothetical protein VJ918_04770 [Adlercreutzia sp. R21]|uniref:hypothetical protein n=1 Tax=Adlercreutzia wanghongyangiae TaxID=3111451 RepID=UPI002DB90EAF|nr:hypothetical protein [Adlercreutzia sp. R21]MEC4184118.1 hypothetical protein [Adlercreutzia sp. R21]